MSTSAHPRERLIAAAWDVLKRTDFDGFKVASVIRKAGVSTKTFYRYFASKDEMLVELLRDEARRGSARISRLVGGIDDPELCIRAWIDATMSAAALPELRARTELFSGLARQRVGPPSVFADIRGELIAPLIAAIEDGVRSGRFTSADSAADAARIHGMCNSAVTDIVAGDGATDPDEIIGSIHDFALRALTAR